jgi:hypothetical protein
METPEEAEAAVAALQGTELGGKAINVEKVCFNLCAFFHEEAGLGLTPPLPLLSLPFWPYNMRLTPLLVYRLAAGAGAPPRREGTTDRRREGTVRVFSFSLSIFFGILFA